MSGPTGGLPALPLARLRCSRGDPLRALLARQPNWGTVGPGHQRLDGDRGASCYRLAADGPFVQVHWRARHGAWEEADCELVPGAIVALRLVLDGADPARITALLDLPPTRAFGKGDSGVRGARFRDEGLWIHEVMPHGFCWPEEKLGELLALLRGRPGFRDVLRLPGVSWAGVTMQMRGCLEQPGALVLDQRLLEDLVGLSLHFDLAVVAE